jgi:hypothetical protein
MMKSHLNDGQMGEDEVKEKVCAWKCVHIFKGFECIVYAIHCKFKKLQGFKKETTSGLLTSAPVHLRGPAVQSAGLLPSDRNLNWPGSNMDRMS